MNIFILDGDPVVAAQMACDKHVVKMVLESAQLLCTAHRVLNPDDDFQFYKATHVNHPCNKWIREHTNNYNWLCEHALALCEEYQYRYNKVHKCQSIIEWCRSNIPNIKNANSLFFLDGYWVTEPPQCMPDKWKCPGFPIHAYRDFYFGEKRHKFNCVWTKREKPWWWKSKEALEELTAISQELNLY